jgi:hypothetical protein
MGQRVNADMREMRAYANLPQIRKACAKCFEFPKTPLKQVAINKKTVEARK